MALSETGGEAGEPETIVKASVLGGFSETAETKALLSILPEIHGNVVTSESTTERFLGEIRGVNKY